MDIAKKFFFIGLGIGGPTKLSLEAYSILTSVDEIYFEIYTNFTASSIEEYERFLNRKFTPIYRNQLENESKNFLLDQKNKNSALLVSGDPFIATTHHILLVEALELGLSVEVLNNTSIYSLTPSLLGLSSYKFGKTATIPFSDRIESDVPYFTLEQNINGNNHSLFLLDVDIVEAKFLTIDSGVDYLLNQEEKHKKKIVSEDSKAIAICKLGHNDSKIIYASLSELKEYNWSQFGPPQSLVIPGKLSAPEEESLKKVWSKNGFQTNLMPIRKKVVVTGTFDILHPGHLAFFSHAKQLIIPSELWVVVARNSSVTSFKNREPILDENVRLTMLNALKIVDKAVLGNEGKDKIKIIEELSPDLIVLGYDQWINEEKLKEELIRRGLTSTKIIRLEKFGTDGYSSSSEIRKKIATTFNKRQL